MSKTRISSLVSDHTHMNTFVKVHDGWFKFYSCPIESERVSLVLVENKALNRNVPEK